MMLPDNRAQRFRAAEKYARTALPNLSLNTPKLPRPLIVFLVSSDTGRRTPGTSR